MKLISPTFSTIIALSFLAPSLRADSFTWNGGGSDSNFSTAGNWGGTAPLAGTANDFTFAGSTRTTPIVGNNSYSTSSITFDASAASFNITPATFSTGSYRFAMAASGAITQNSANDQIISATIYQANVPTGASMAIAGTGTGSLTLNSVRLGISGAATAAWDIQRDVTIGQVTRAFTQTGTWSLSVASGKTATISGTIAGTDTSTATSFTLQKSGSGTLILSGSNLNTGATVVSAGTLLINGNQTSATGDVSVAAGAVIGGTGTIGGATTVSGNLQAGNDGGVGLLSFASSLMLENSANSVFEINGLTRGTEFDAINVAGALTYDGELTLNFGFIASVGQEFDLFNMTSHSGAFSGINFLNAGYDGVFDYNTGILTLTAVPEPGSLTMCLFGGILGVALLRRRKQHAN